jgi:hypothetical protein
LIGYNDFKKVSTYKNCQNKDLSYFQEEEGIESEISHQSDGPNESAVKTILQKYWV